MKMNNKRIVRVVKKKQNAVMKYSERKLLDTSDSGDLTLFQLSTQTCGTNFKFVTVKIIILILFGFFGRV